MLTIVLMDICGLEILWVLDVVEDSAEGLEATVLSASCDLCLALMMSRASIIESATSSLLCPRLFVLRFG